MDQFIPIGERIAIQRRRRGLSQEQLAHRLGRTPQWLSNLERGARPAAMAHPVTLFTGQWTDLPLDRLAEKAAN